MSSKKSEKYFYQLSAEEAVSKLGTDAKKGLTQADAEKRLTQYGPNELKEGERRPMIFRFFDQFKDLLIIVLIIAALLAYYLDDFRGGTILLIIVLVNAVIGFYQEYKAEKILESLKKIIQAKAIVIRDGKQMEITQEKLVPGDLVYLEEGSAVPADVRLVSTTYFSTNDFILTGESVPQEKRAELIIPKETTLTNQDNLVFMGVTVAKGNAYGIVYGTGMDTAIGRIARTTAGIRHDLSPLQREINSLAKTLTKLAGIIALGLFIINFALNYDNSENLAHLVNISILFSIGVAAACVPQGLPAQVSVALSLGVGRLAEKKAIVKKLSAVETLGSTSVICSDKTGTITRNEMTIAHCSVNGRRFKVTGEGYDPKGQIVELLSDGKMALMTGKDIEPIKQFFEDGFLASDGRTHKPDKEHSQWHSIGDPTEAAFTPLLIKAGLKPENIEKKFAVIREFPFDSDRKRMSVIHEHKGKKIAYMKGALESVLSACTKINHGGKEMALTDSEKKRILREGEALASEALRVIALAYRDIKGGVEKMTEKTCERDFVFSGFVAMMDPPKPGVKEAVKAAYEAKIRLMMITGDNAVTAQAIAKKIGMMREGEDVRILNGDDIKSMNNDRLKRALLAQSVIFSRVSPEDKFRIVSLLKKMGEVVAVTGDGVNDTLSLKRSDIGVAMGKVGSQVAKEASDMILLDDNFRTIVVAIREGRNIFNNLKKTIVATVTANLGELSCVLLGFVGIAFGLPAPITAVQILAVDLIAELLPLTALTFDPADGNLLSKPPRNLHHHIINRRSLSLIAFFGLCHGMIAFFSFYVVYKQTGSLAQAQAAAYGALVVCQLINILSERSEQSVFSRYTLRNPQLWGSILISGIAVWSIINISVLNVWFGFGTLNMGHWLIPFVGALALLILHEAIKMAVRRKWLQSSFIE